MKRPRSTVLGALLTAGVVVLAGCAPGPASTSTPDVPAQAASGLTGEPIKIGLAEPTTGPSAQFGLDQVTAAVWAADDINRAGGVAGRPLQIDTIDTKADPQLGVAAARRFVDLDKVPAIVAGFSTVVSAIAPIANDSKTLTVSVGANAPTIAKLGNYVRTSYPLADVDLTALANYSHRTMGKSRAAVLYINNDTGKYGAEAYRTAFEAAGGTVAAYEAYQPTDTSYAGQIQKVAAAHPDVIHIQGLIDELPQVIAQIRQAGITAQITTYSAGYNPTLIKTLGSAAEGLIVTNLAPGAADRPAVGAYVKRWQQQKGRAPYGLPYTMYFYDSVYLMKQLTEHVLKKGQPITGDNLTKALTEIGTFDLPLTGKVTFNADHTVTKPVYLLTVKNGDFAPLAQIAK